MTSPYDVLTRITSSRSAPEPAGERCEMCSEPIADEHQHVVNVAARQLMCVCRACYLLFTDTRPSCVTARCRTAIWRFPISRWIAAPGRHCRSRSAWPSSSPTPRWGARSPSIPARPGRPNPSWTWIPGTRCSGADSRVDLLADDVEALLVRVPEDGDDGETAQPQTYLVPIDACYEFVGRLRMLWRGFDGGQEARAFIDGFFAQIQARSRETPVETPR